MKGKEMIKRIIYVAVAFISGLCIVWALSVAGNKSQGPIENLLTQTQQTVEYIEHKTILQQREHKRSDKLEWFKPISGNVENLKYPVKILWGASDTHTKESYETIINLEDSLQTTFPLIHIYTAWGSKNDQQFPKVQVKTILELGSLPIITWEPWLSDFDEKEYPGIPKAADRDKGGMAEVARGVYDKYLQKWAKAAKEIQRPIFVRMGHEMNDPYRYPWGPQNNKPEEFIAAWKHIHEVFVKAGATNVIWVWSPHPAYGYFDAFYPGNDYVDYIGVGILNYGTVANWSKWWSFEEMFATHYTSLENFQKPIMITEFGSLSVGGDRAQWFAGALDSIPVKYPNIKSIVFYHYSSDKTLTDKALNWYFINDTASINTIRGRISR